MSRRKRFEIKGFMRELTVRNLYGIYARPAAKIVRIASRYESDITISCGCNTSSAKSIMGLLTLEAYQGFKLTFVARGPDAREALDELADLVNGGFDSGDSLVAAPDTQTVPLHREPRPGPARPGRPWRTVRLLVGSGIVPPAETAELARHIQNMFADLRARCLRRHIRCTKLAISFGEDWMESLQACAIDTWSDMTERDHVYILVLTTDNAAVPPFEDAPKRITDLRRVIEMTKDGVRLSHDQINALVSCYPRGAANAPCFLRPDIDDDDSETIRSVFQDCADFWKQQVLTFSIQQGCVLADQLPLWQNPPTAPSTTSTAAPFADSLLNTLLLRIEADTGK